MLPDKTPVQSWAWDHPTPPPKAPRCVEGQKEGAVIHVGDVFKNNVKDDVGKESAPPPPPEVASTTATWPFGVIFSTAFM